MFGTLDPSEVVDVTCSKRIELGRFNVFPRRFDSMGCCFCCVFVELFMSCDFDASIVFVVVGETRDIRRFVGRLMTSS